MHACGTAAAPAAEEGERRARGMFVVVREGGKVRVEARASACRGTVFGVERNSPLLSASFAVSEAQMRTCYMYAKYGPRRSRVADAVRVRTSLQTPRQNRYIILWYM